MKIESWKVVVFVLLFVIVAYALFPRGRKLAEMYMASFRWEEAFKILEQELIKHPDDPRLLKDLARYVESQGETQKEIKLYEKLVELRPHNLDYRKRLAQLYRWNNRVDDELKQLEVMARVAPNDIDTHVRLADFYHWYKKLDKAVPHHLKLIKLRPKETAYYHDLADTYMHLGEYDKGIAIYEELIQKNPKNSEFRFTLADVYEWKGYLDKALKQYFAYLDLRFPKAQISKKIFREPLKWDQLGGELNDRDVQVLDHLVMVKTDQKKFQDAEGLYESLEGSFPNQIQWKEKRAEFYVASDQLDKASESYQSLSQQFPKNNSYLFQLAQIAIWKKKIGNALNIYKNIKQKDPQNVQAQEGVAKTALWLNHHREAIDAYRSLAERFPANFQYQRQLGFLYLWDNNSQLSKKYLEDYARHDPKDKEVQMALASLRLPQLINQKDYFKASHELQSLSDPSLEWFRKEIKKQTAWKVFTQYQYVQTVDKQSRQGEFIHDYDGKVSKYVANRFQIGGHYRLLDVKDSAQSPILLENISTLGMEMKYDLATTLNFMIEPQFYVDSLFQTTGCISELKWNISQDVYTNITGSFHELWTAPLDAVRYKGTKSGVDMYTEYIPHFLNKRFSLIPTLGWNTYFTDGGEGRGYANTGTMKALIAFWSHPKIEVGYFLDYQLAVQNELLLAHSPLVRRILSHNIVSQMDWRPSDVFRLFMSGSMGEDQKRKLLLKDTALFNYLFKGEWQVSRRLFLSGTYAYSSESSLVSKGAQSVVEGQLNYSFH